MSHPEEQQLSQLNVAELVEQTMITTGLLAEKQIELLRVEITSAIALERARAIEVGTGALCAMLGVNVLLVAAALGLGRAFGRPELFALGIGLVIAVTGAALTLIGLRKQPTLFASSRRIVTEEITWAKQQLSETKSFSSPKTSNASGAEASR